VAQVGSEGERVVSGWAALRGRHNGDKGEVGASGRADVPEARELNGGRQGGWRWARWVRACKVDGVQRSEVDGGQRLEGEGQQRG
jgi:hypothetical protein